MENAIMAKEFTFESKELKKATAAIIKATDSAAKSLLKIASIMAEVDARELYKDDFKSTVEYGEKVFGYKKSAVYNMVRVGRDYIDPETGKSVLALENGQDFTFNQLARMLPLPSVEDAEKLVEEETITPKMSLREIEQVVKDYNHKDDPSEDTETKTNAETKTETETETEDVLGVNFLTIKLALDAMIGYCKSNAYNEPKACRLEAIKELVEKTEDAFIEADKQ